VELPALDLTRVRSVLVWGDVCTEGDRRLLVVPSVYLGDDEDERPEEGDTLFEDDALPDELLLLTDDERPED
jgi:hypothetical protein